MLADGRTVVVVCITVVVEGTPDVVVEIGGVMEVMATFDVDDVNAVAVSSCDFVSTGGVVDVGVCVACSVVFVVNTSAVFVCASCFVVSFGALVAELCDVVD